MMPPNPLIHHSLARDAFQNNDVLPQVMDATDEATFLAAAQPLEDIAAYIGAGPLLRFVKKEQLIEALVFHAVYTRKIAAISQYVYQLKPVLALYATFMTLHLGVCFQCSVISKHSL